ncbi:uncharacterized protein G2W53_001338 [Senna tora]|uniref:Uncharacterized protein n=1 Tax=Senna tora TaxID=362788 RepID=A0A834XFN6_9FABA|nr:uncharacterized protein G2W53_001338 [Senna tora]
MTDLTCRFLVWGSASVPRTTPPAMTWGLLSPLPSVPIIPPIVLPVFPPVSVIPAPRRLRLLPPGLPSFFSLLHFLKCNVAKRHLHLQSLNLPGRFGEPDEEILEGFLLPLHHILQAVGGPLNRPTGGEVGENQSCASPSRVDGKALHITSSGAPAYSIAALKEFTWATGSEVPSYRRTVRKNLIPPIWILTNSHSTPRASRAACCSFENQICGSPASLSCPLLLPCLPSSYASPGFPPEVTSAAQAGLSSRPLRAVSASSKAVVRSCEGPPAAPPSIL